MLILNSADRLLEVRNLSAGYDGRDVIQNIDLHVDDGEIVSIIGPNGSGKSTLLKAIIGIVHTRLGGTFYRSIKVTDVKTYDLVKNGILLMPQGKRVFPGLTVAENLSIPGKLLSLDELQFSLLQDGELFSLVKSKWTILAGKLSGGEQQMVALIRAFAMRPQLLLLDEPTQGLSPKLSNDVFEIIKSMVQCRRIGVLMVEHKVRLSIGISNRWYGMRLGKVVTEGKCERVDEKQLRTVFLE